MALLVLARVKAHLHAARQDWMAEEHTPERRPRMVCIGTSATIKSIDEEGRPRTRSVGCAIRQSKEFFSRLTGETASAIRVLGEEIKAVDYPPGAAWAAGCPAVEEPNHDDPDAVRSALAKIAGLPEGATLQQATQRARIIWYLSDSWPAKKPMSIKQIVELVAREIPERHGVAEPDLRREIQAALVAASALPESSASSASDPTGSFGVGGGSTGAPTPDAGNLYAKGEAECGCGAKTAPSIYLCRSSCGAHAMGYWGTKRSWEVALGPE